MTRAVNDPTGRNVALLAVCQALGMSSSALVISVSALVGSALAPDTSLATLPLALQMAGVMATTAPASLLMRRIGRRAGFSLGAVLGMMAGGLGTWAIVIASFPLFCLASVLFGSFNAHVQYYRFAAADTARQDFKGRAISLVLAGGLLAAFLGPELAKWSRELIDSALYAGAYLCITGLALLSLVILQFVQVPRLEVKRRGDAGRPLLVIAARPIFVVAVLSGMVGYGTMNLAMSVTPLAAVAAEHPFAIAAFVIQWHIVGMYGPSFFTGQLIRRFGVLPILAVGAIFMLGAAATNLAGLAVVNFWGGLVLLGVGWNFLYVGGSTLLTEAYRPEEMAKVQGLNEFLIFGTVTLTALGAGALYHAFGWSAVNIAIVGPNLLVLAVLAWLARRTAAAA